MNIDKEQQANNNHYTAHLTVTVSKTIRKNQPNWQLELEAATYRKVSHILLI